MRWASGQLRCSGSWVVLRLELVGLHFAEPTPQSA